MVVTSKADKIDPGKDNLANAKYTNSDIRSIFSVSSLYLRAAFDSVFNDPMI